MRYAIKTVSLSGRASTCDRRARLLRLAGGKYFVVERFRNEYDLETYPDPNVLCVSANPYFSYSREKIPIFIKQALGQQVGGRKNYRQMD